MLFTYTALDKNGKKITVTEEAYDEESLVAKLQSKDMVVVEVLPAIGSAEAPSISPGQQRAFKYKRLKLNDMVLFSRQLATMLDSGVTLLKSLEIILQQVESKKLHDCLFQVKMDLERGLSFSSCLARHPRVFSQFWVSLAEVGEASGTLPLILERLANYLEEKAAFQSKVLSAILYPAVLFLVCVGALIIFATVIIPKFTEVFKNFGIKLPFLSQLVVDSFDFIRAKFLIIFLVIGGIIYFIKNYTKTAVGKKQFEAFLFKVPVFRKFYTVFLIERFTAQMSILVESGVPILYALEICQRMIGNKTMEEVIGFVKKNVRQGRLIAEPMRSSGFFTPMVVQMVLIGEETGELGKMLKKVAFFYQNYIATFLTRFTSLFEPIMIVFMGFVVGTIVIAMFLPILSIATMSSGMQR